MLFFFYGTLMDGELLRMLAGPRAEDLRLTPGILMNYRRQRARFGNYPVLLPHPGGRVPGLFVEGLDRQLLLWVAHFEGPGYLPQRVSARDQAARQLRPWAFVPLHPGLASPESWDFEAWQRGDKPRVRRLLRDWVLQSTPGRPLALDAPWRVRRRLETVCGQGNDQPQPNPDLPGLPLESPAGAWALGSERSGTRLVPTGAPASEPAPSPRRKVA